MAKRTRIRSEDAYEERLKLIRYLMEQGQPKDWIAGAVDISLHRLNEILRNEEIGPMRGPGRVGDCTKKVYAYIKALSNKGMSASQIRVEAATHFKWTITPSASTISRWLRTGGSVGKEFAPYQKLS